MPIGQLLFAVAPPGSVWLGTVGLDAYAIIRQSNTAIFPTLTYITVYLGSGSLSQVGTATTFEGAVTLAQNHLAGLAT